MLLIFKSSPSAFGNSKESQESQDVQRRKPTVADVARRHSTGRPTELTILATQNEGVLFDLRVSAVYGLGSFSELQFSLHAKRSKNAEHQIHRNIMRVAIENCCHPSP